MIPTLLFVMGFLGQGGSATPLAQAPAIEAEHLKALVNSLCTVETAGRKTGTPGYEAAAGVVVGELERIGLVPGGEDGYRQWVPMLRWSVAPEAQGDGVEGAPRAPRLFVTDKAGEEHEFVCGIDFGLPLGKQGAPPAGKTLKITIVREISDLPEQANSDGAICFLGREARGYFREWLAGKQQAVGDWGMIIVGRSQLSGQAEVIPKPYMELDYGAADPGDTLFVRGQSLALFKADDVVSLRIEANWKHEQVVSENLIGILPGVGSSAKPELADEVIVLTANLDHLGRKALPSLGSTPRTFDGADNNATGVAALLEIASALASDPPARTILFLFATGNEQGFLGVQHQLRAPALPLEQTKLALDVWSLGEQDPLMPVPNSLWITSFADTTVGPGLQQSDLLIFPDERYRWHYDSRSASILYKRAGIPGHRISSYGGHDRLNSPRDEAQYLDYPHMEKVTRILLEAVRLLASDSFPIEDS